MNSRPNQIPLPSPSSKEQRQLAAWVDGGQLDQNVAQNIRIILYDLIERAIDWDQERLLPGHLRQ